MEHNQEPMEQEQREQTQDHPQEADKPAPEAEAPRGPQNSKERFYEKLPFTYRQVDIFLKCMIVAIVVVLILGVVYSK